MVAHNFLSVPSNDNCILENGWWIGQREMYKHMFVCDRLANVANGQVAWSIQGLSAHIHIHVDIHIHVHTHVRVAASHIYAQFVVLYVDEYIYTYMYM